MPYQVALAPIRPAAYATAAAPAAAQPPAPAGQRASVFCAPPRPDTLRPRAPGARSRPPAPAAASLAPRSELLECAWLPRWAGSGPRGGPAVLDCQPAPHPGWRPRVPDLLPHAGRPIPNDPGARRRWQQQGAGRAALGQRRWPAQPTSCGACPRQREPKRGRAASAKRYPARQPPFLRPPQASAAPRDGPNDPNALAGVCDRPLPHEMGGGPSFLF